MKSKQVIEDVVERCSNQEGLPSRFSTMTYEEGVEAALRWVQDEDPYGDYNEWPFIEDAL